MTRVVSLTPVAIERDTRTYKHAASLARLGYESVVVEGRRSSSLPESLPFQLLTSDPDEAPAPAGPRPDVAPQAGTRRDQPDRVRPGARLVRSLMGSLGRVRAGAVRLLRERLPFHYLRQYASVNRTTFRALPDASLYYLHSYWQFPAVGRKCRGTGAAIIYDAHDSYRDIPRVPIPGVPAALRLVESRCVRRSNARTTTSAGMAARLERRFKRSFEVVRNCQDPRLAETPESDLRTAAGVPADDFLVVMVGNQKLGIAFDSAFDAIDRLGEGIHLAFLGAGYDERAALARDRGLDRRVHFLPPVRPTAVSGYIRTADASILLYAPVTENYLITLPNGLFYAVAAGLPLIHPRFGEMGAVAERHQLGIPIDANDPGSVANAILRLRESPKLGDRFRENARRAQSELSWEHDERTLAGVVRGALEGHPA